VPEDWKIAMEIGRASARGFCFNGDAEAACDDI
jgi:hypothetical protein